MNYSNNKIWRKEKKSKHKCQIQEATKGIINKAENNKMLQNVIKLIPILIYGAAIREIFQAPVKFGKI
jgi:hypothetical protein